MYFYFSITLLLALMTLSSLVTSIFTPPQNFSRKQKIIALILLHFPRCF